jgi:hypothetical protein
MGAVFVFSPEQARQRACNRVRLSQWLERFSSELQALVDTLPRDEKRWQLSWLRDGVDAAFIQLLFGSAVGVNLNERRGDQDAD